MRIALLKFGLCRNVDDLIKFFNRFNKFINCDHVDVFVYTNDVYGYHNLDLMGVDETKIKETDFEKIKSELKPKIFYVKSFQEEIKETSNIFNIYYRNNKHKQKLQNLIAKWYKFKKLSEMYEKYKTDNQINYDAVIVTRFDGQFTFKFDINQFKNCRENIIYVPGQFWSGRHSYPEWPNDEQYKLGIEHGNFGYVDDWWYCKDSMLKTVSNMYDFICEKHKTEDYQLHAESVYTDFLFEKKIEVELIKWSSDITIHDFYFHNVIEKVGQSSCPDVKTKCYISKSVICI